MLTQEQVRAQLSEVKHITMVTITGPGIYVYVHYIQTHHTHTHTSLTSSILSQFSLYSVSELFNDGLVVWFKNPGLLKFSIANVFVFVCVCVCT